ncbi:MAG: alpha-E domain-containing protein [Lachnospiraceae bacterium]|nr:alpha-E domain-containing protein [Lachnospiraceae bacterium]
MGAVSIETIDELYWLGRYTERVFTTLQVFEKIYDQMIDSSGFGYDDYCERLAIPNIYVSKEDFIRRYLFDEENPDSLLSNLLRAYDNAILLRQILSSEALAYIHMSLDVLKSSKDSRTPLWSLQPLTDYLFAFWGSVEDYVEDEDERNILKAGKLCERLDLYLRLDMPLPLVEREFCRLRARVSKHHVEYNLIALARLGEIIGKGEAWKEQRQEALTALGSILEML